MKYLIVGLGNIGVEYNNTRHNIGFKVLDALVEASNTCFTTDRYASIAMLKYRGQQMVLIKPSTYMNLSGKAVNYWLQKEKIHISNLLVVTDDIALPLATFRIKVKGGDGGHNGLKHISETLGHSNFYRFRYGVGNNFNQGQQVDFVLGKWTPEELNLIKKREEDAVNAIYAFVSLGIERTMNYYNGDKVLLPESSKKKTTNKNLESE